MTVAAPVVPAAPCPSAAVAAHLPAATRGIRVDLDGDGTADRAVIRHPASFALANWGGDPSLVLTARVRPGVLDAVIRMGRGASSTIFELFGVVGGRLRPVLSYWNGGFASQGSTGWGCGGAGEVVRRWVGSAGYEEDRYALRGTRYVRIARRGDSHLRRSPSWLDAVVGRRSIGFGNCAVRYA